MLQKMRPLFVWLASCAVSLASWAGPIIMADPSWSVLLRPINAIPALGIVGGVTLALLGRSPLTK